MPSEKALALVLRTTDWSETSRIATLWTRELGKVRVLAKGGKRLKSSFESSLDLLTLCRIVLLRKSSGNLDLLTEARVEQRFPGLAHDLPSLYAAYYIAELLGDWTEDYDPHPGLFDEARKALEDLGRPAAEDQNQPPPARARVGLRVARFELVLLRELGYSPLLNACAGCQGPIAGRILTFSSAAGGLLCAGCQHRQRDARTISARAGEALRLLSESAEAWQQTWESGVRAEVRQVLGSYITYLLGRQPRMLPYLQGS
jgi:DNA repair protein RecO (recombination protein O)